MNRTVDSKILSALTQYDWVYTEFRILRAATKYTWYDVDMYIVYRNLTFAWFFLFEYFSRNAQWKIASYMFYIVIVQHNICYWRPWRDLRHTFGDVQCEWASSRGRFQHFWNEFMCTSFYLTKTSMPPI